MFFYFFIPSTIIVVLSRIAVAEISVDYYFGHPQLRTKENLEGFECSDKLLEAHCLDKCGSRHICVLDKCFCVEKGLPGGYDANNNVEGSAGIGEISNNELGGHIELIRPVLQSDNAVATRNSDGLLARTTTESSDELYPRPYSKSNVLLLRGPPKLNNSLLRPALHLHNVLASPGDQSNGLLAQIKAKLANLLKQPTEQSDTSVESPTLQSNSLLTSPDKQPKDILQWKKLLKYSSESDNLLKKMPLPSYQLMPQLPLKEPNSLLKLAQQSDIYLIRPVRQYPSNSPVKVSALQPLQPDDLLLRQLIQSVDILANMPRGSEELQPDVKPLKPSPPITLSNSEMENEMQGLLTQSYYPLQQLQSENVMPSQSLQPEVFQHQLLFDNHPPQPLQSDNVLLRQLRLDDTFQSIPSGSEKMPPYVKEPPTKFDNFIIPALPTLLRISNSESENEMQDIFSQLDNPLPQLVTPPEERRPVLRHHIAHFCPNLDIARQCIRKCMKLGKPAFCGKDHVCYCGHKYGTPGETEDASINPKDVYSQYKDLYLKYFGPPN